MVRIKYGAICEVPLFNGDEEEISNILKTYQSVAIIGLSNNEEKPSYRVGEYLKGNGFRIYPVNPGYEEIFGEKCYKSLSDISDPIEIVDIFRKPSAVKGIVEEAIGIGAKVVWMQSGVVNNDAASIAKEAGLKVVMDRCMMAEHRRIKGSANP